MNKITKQNLHIGPSGKIIDGQIVEIIDDGKHIVNINKQLVQHCLSCHRPIDSVRQWMGRCDCCNRSICDQCVSRCQACGRRLCGRCRHSFVGKHVIQVCCTCYPKLIKHQKMINQIMFDREKFRRQQLLKQMALRRDALRLKALKQSFDNRISLYNLVKPIQNKRLVSANAKQRR